MEGKLKSFRKRSREENRGRSRAGHRYSRQLRLDGVAYLEQQKRGGASVEQVARELGVSSVSLLRWSGENERSGSLVPVEVQSPDARSSLRIVTPGGYRVEGLSEEGVLRVIEQLG